MRRRSRLRHRRSFRRRSFRIRRRRSFHRRSRRFGRRMGFGIWGLVNKVAPPIAFLDQLNTANRQDYSGKDAFTKAKILANSVTGKILNFNVFGDVPQYHQRLNPAGIANKYTAIGIVGLLGGLIYPRLGLRIPMVGKGLSLGRKLLGPGIIAGLFDDPPGYSHATYFSQSTVSSTYCPIAYTAHRTG